MDENRQSRHIVAIQGSIRPGNFTGKALALVVDEFAARKDYSVELINPADLNLGMPGQNIESSDSELLQEKVKSATGVILATPEYHGSISSVIKMVLENLGFPSVLSTKPVALLGVAAGQIGAIKSLEQLRSICSHVGAIVLPGPVSVANVQKMFDEKGNCLDESVEKQIRGVAANLAHYIEGAVCPRIALEQLTRQGAVSG